MENIAVIFGGGSYGAYHVGTMSRLNLDFDAVFGTSTGGLQAPLVALGEYERLRKAYTSLTQYSIFDNYWTNPIRSNGKIHIPKAVLRIARGKKTIGSTSHALAKTIQEFYTAEDHLRLQASRKFANVCVTNLSSANPSIPVYYNSNDSDYSEFVQMMRASGSFPAVMSPIIQDNQEYVDGGLVETGSVREAMKHKPKNLHLFVHKTSIYDEPSVPVTANFFHLLMRIVYTMMNEVQLNDLHQDNLKLWSKHYGVENIYVHWMQKDYTNRLVFDKKEMQQMFEDGFDYAEVGANRIEIV